MPSIFEVGGAVRDRLLGIKSKDRDFSFVLSEAEISENESIEAAFGFMKTWIESKCEIKQITERALTVKAMVPGQGVCDFVLARKDIGMEVGSSRMPICLPGSLRDDLLRRDFTINALAEEVDIDTLESKGSILDICNGLRDLDKKILRTPLDPRETLFDDPLRALRLIRFMVRLGFKPDTATALALFDPRLPAKTAEKVSTDRIREELGKALKEDTFMTLKLIADMVPESLSKEWLNRQDFWLMPTTRK